jgi:site-specific recombinase XerD
MQVDNILDFLSHIEKRRGNTAGTRNSRLAAIRSFFKHLGRQDPTNAEQFYQVLSLQAKKARQRPAFYLEPEEVKVILEKPDRKTFTGLRDRALILFLYNSGARVGETLMVKEDDLHLERPHQVMLHGKGKKDRLCPLWRETAMALKRLLSSDSPSSNSVIFRNLRGETLSRDGVAYILNKYVVLSHTDLPRLRRHKVTPHVLRHSCAVALLQAGNDVTVIRDYLGHATVATTNRYISTNLQMKREALESFWKKSGLSTSNARSWKPKGGLLAFLSSL